MLPFRPAITRPTADAAYVCLTCRLKLQKRRNHDTLSIRHTWPRLFRLSRKKRKPSSTQGTIRKVLLESFKGIKHLQLQHDVAVDPPKRSKNRGVSPVERRSTFRKVRAISPPLPPPDLPRKTTPTFRKLSGASGLAPSHRRLMRPSVEQDIAVDPAVQSEHRRLSPDETPSTVGKYGSKSPAPSSVEQDISVESVEPPDPERIGTVAPTRGNSGVESFKRRTGLRKPSDASPLEKSGLIRKQITRSQITGYNASRDEPVAPVNWPKWKRTLNQDTDGVRRTETRVQVSDEGLNPGERPKSFQVLDRNLQTTPLENLIGDHLDREQLAAQRRQPMPESDGGLSSVRTETPNTEAASETHPPSASQLGQRAGPTFTFFVPGRTFTWKTIPTIANSTLTAGQNRTYHSSTKITQQALAATAAAPDPGEPVKTLTSGDATDAPGGIRAQLREWQALHGHEDPMLSAAMQGDVADGYLNKARIQEQSRMQTQEEEEGGDQALAHFTQRGMEGYEGIALSDLRHLQMGDLVEIEWPGKERESTLGVFVQRLENTLVDSRFLAMDGRWMDIQTARVQHSIPGWVSPKLVEPLLEHLPSPDETMNTEKLREEAYLHDLSVPREISAPLVTRMVKFWNESQGIYRRHANTLDNAHALLAHDTDLRYGSITSAATSLLKIATDKLSLTAMYAVYKALKNGGFAFNFDSYSHRVTGYVQIRSKEQVLMVEQVRDWVREWQEDLAINSARKNPTTPRNGAAIIYNFLKRAKAIVAKHRKNRQPIFGQANDHPRGNNVGPSKVRLPITASSECVKMTTNKEFTQEDTQIIHFLEAWSCTASLTAYPRLMSLPPLLLQATGLYPNTDLKPAMGFLFLQELGVMLPWENRVRFDNHLLLPSSQISKPLQKLTQGLLLMAKDPGFEDSMADLRHDWRNLRVYCIDDSSAQEIDDGISLESAGTGLDGRPQHWIHVHVANPTAYLSRDNPLAKMARHMGETLYMPEQTYAMLPRWTSTRHFSLGPDRPCLTISVKVDADANTLEHKITPGIIRNVMNLTGDEVVELTTGSRPEKVPETILRVGDEPPRTVPRRSPFARADAHDVQTLQILQQLAEGRSRIRGLAGASFQTWHTPTVRVWQRRSDGGLPWYQPYRKGARTVEGDPIIELRTRPLVNAFAERPSPSETLVGEMMVLACESAAKWCAQRQIPILYRATKPPPGSNTEQTWREMVAPFLNAKGEVPLHLGDYYVQKLGRPYLSTTPARHEPMALSQYSRVTSPLRRYGDMIAHWQIGAALRHEADTGKSLISPPGRHVDRSFLPFSRPVLETIKIGLQPREYAIRRASRLTQEFWVCLLLFRKFYFGENGGLPYLGAQGDTPLHCHIIDEPKQLPRGARATVVELSLPAFIFASPTVKEPLEHGDVWEVRIAGVDVYNRNLNVDPVRLVGRQGAGMF